MQQCAAPNHLSVYICWVRQTAAAALLAAIAGSSSSHTAAMHEVQKSPSDKKCYRIIQLENGLTALLIHDPAVAAGLQQQPQVSVTPQLTPLSPQPFRSPALTAATHACEAQQPNYEQAAQTP